MSRFAAAPLVLLLLLLAAAPARAGSCPTDTLSVSDDQNEFGNGGIVTAQDSSRAIAPAINDAYRTQEASYQLASGTIRARAWHVVTGLLPGPGTHARVAAHDTYTLLGPDGAGEISFTARLSVSSVCGGEYEYACTIGPEFTCSMPAGGALASIREGAANMASSAYESNGAYDHALDVSITRAPGGTFELALSAQAEAAGLVDTQHDRGSSRSASVTARLSFPDLPPGWSVISCQGFRAGHIVPARTTTWGRLKTSYR